MYPGGKAMPKAVLFDLDGVFYQGETPVPGAAEVAAWCRQERIPHLYLTNTTSRSRADLAARLAAMGLPIEEARILTPAMVAVRWLQEQGIHDAALFVPRSTRDDFREISIASDDAESTGAVLVGDLGREWDFSTLNRAFRLLLTADPPPLIALGMTRYWHAADGLRLDVGPFVVALEYATDVRATILGKPAAPFFHAALQLAGSAPGETVMVGDDIRGDVEGAQKAGIQGILVRTGKFRPGDLQLDIRPDAVLGSVAEFPAWWAGSP
ncbi:MAG: TIGR01458 family HAD-type hydrolase [Desulfuromonadales bacterium]|nr:TIGR01458 family HAD-type hydrolase [Desulfuromonadales bacterium]